MSGCNTDRAPRVAVLLSGGARTMATSQAKEDFRAFFQWLGAQCTTLHLFAYIELRPQWATHLRTLRSDAVYGQAASEAAVRGALDAYGVPYEAFFHDEDAEWAEVQTNTTAAAGQAQTTATGHAHKAHPWAELVSDFLRERRGATTRAQVISATKRRIHALGPLQQWLKVAAAARMMARYEQQRGFLFDVVLRMRPDVCALEARPFVSYALQQTNLSCASLVAYLQRDVVAMLPRPLAVRFLAYKWTRYMRNSVRVSLTDAPGGGESEVVAADACGAEGLELDLNHHRSNLGVAQVRLRRPTGCAKWN